MIRNKKVYLAFAGIALIGFILFPFVMYHYETKKVERHEKAKKSIENKAEQNESSMLHPDQTDDQIVKSFITELMGDDYELIEYLFNPNKLDGLTSKQIAEGIKEGKKMVRGQVIDIQRGKMNRYKIDLEFLDGTVKTIYLEVGNGKIETNAGKLTNIP